MYGYIRVQHTKKLQNRAFLSPLQFHCWPVYPRLRFTFRCDLVRVINFICIWFVCVMS